MSASNGTGFDHASIDRVIARATLPDRAPAFAEGAKHLPCVECSIGTWWQEPLVKGTIFRCDCGTMLLVESDVDDPVVHVVDASEPVEPAPAVRPTAPGVDELIAAGNRSREWRVEASKRLHTLMRRLVRTGGSEEDAAAVLDGEAQKWRGKHERRKTRERSAAKGGGAP